MKKIYLTPKMESVMIEDIQPLCTSGGVGGSGIPGAPDFGGIDPGGKEPSAKEIAEFEDAIDGLLW